MESFGSFSNEDWHSLARMFSSDLCDLGLNFETPNILMSVSDESSNVDQHLVNASNGTVSLSYPYHEGFPYCPSDIVLPSSNDACDQSINFHMMNEINNSCLPTQISQDVSTLVSSRETPLKRKHETPNLRCVVGDEINNRKTKNTTKRIRVSRENKTKMNQDTENGYNNNGERNGQSSSSCSSNDDSNGAQEMDCKVNPNGKTRASRGTATDPQSLYARKRRERINERLRILQNLVPNGTKVDISTMLEEAVEYVKFLKLQIQLLSSDDMWMYAPIAYNGVDMGLYQKIAQNL